MRVLTLMAALLTATFAYAQDNIVLRNGEEIPAKVLEVNQTDLKYRKSANPDGPVYSAPLRDVLLIKYANGSKDSFGSNAGPLLTKPAPMSKPDGALMATNLTPVGVEGLRYKGGLFSRFYSTNGQRLGGREVKSLLYSQPDALTSFEKGRSLRTWSVATAIPALALIGTGVGLMIDGGGGHDGMGNDSQNRDNDPTDTNTSGENRGDGHGDGLVVGAVLTGSGVLLGATSLWLNHRATVQFRRAADRYNGRATTSLRFVPSRRGVGLGAVLTF
ncbi:hypothetical protein FAES_pFAES01020 (plasmid) [Fibrella aestuarina BUZ 2]|uniref:Uncharacterized protein n=1 Tax=Fibrella aestuarina BUZ 2 TaxID=1166018 RepID=I0KHB1_9BACT|nr:hypothetical protein [Fibrella aestuarina]CCH03514.1 hypothetical protein FAES_pFAES01020 [Fibrella aestuarina BUZ 2]